MAGYAVAGTVAGIALWSIGVSLAPESLNFMKESRGSGALNVGVTTWIGTYYRIPNDGATQDILTQ